MATHCKLDHKFFEGDSKTIAGGDLEARCFRFPTGVEGVRLSNKRGGVTVLPFQGHQLWHPEFDGIKLSMDSQVKVPIRTTDYLKGYGGFLVLCGARRIGCPAKGLDDHPLHGELPNAQGYEQVLLSFGEDVGGRFVELDGIIWDPSGIDCKVHYMAVPKTKLYENSTLVDFSLRVENVLNEPMETMVMIHANGNAPDNSTLECSAPSDPESVVIRTQDPQHVIDAWEKESAESDERAAQIRAFREFRDAVARNPKLIDRFGKDMLLDPEIVGNYNYRADGEGYAHSMAVFPGGERAYYIRHNPQQLPIGVRWLRIASGDEGFPVSRAAGVVLPANSGVRGYSTEKFAGNIPVMDPLETMFYNVSLGLLSNRGEIDAARGRIEEAMAH